MTEDEMVGWHHQLDGHEFEQAPGVGDGQGSPACCSLWGHKESDTTKRLNGTELMKYCSSQHWTLLPSPVTSMTGVVFVLALSEVLFSFLMVYTLSHWMLSTDIASSPPICGEITNLSPSKTFLCTPHLYAHGPPGGPLAICQTPECLPGPNSTLHLLQTAASPEFHVSEVAPSGLPG